MSEHLINDLKAHGFQVHMMDEEFEKAPSVSDMMQQCRRYVEQSKADLQTVFIVSKTQKSQVIFWATPVNVASELQQDDREREQKAAAERWTSCIFVNGSPLFVTADLTFETLTDAVPLMKNVSKCEK